MVDKGESTFLPSSSFSSPLELYVAVRHHNSGCASISSHFTNAGVGSPIVRC